jgi:hypothetical protein
MLSIDEGNQMLQMFFIEGPDGTASASGAEPEGKTPRIGISGHGLILKVSEIPITKVPTLSACEAR